MERDTSLWKENQTIENEVPIQKQKHGLAQSHFGERRCVSERKRDSEEFLDLVPGGGQTPVSTTIRSEEQSHNSP